MCESFNIQYGTNYIAVMPTNLYGPNDNFDLEKSHVLPAMIRKIHLANAWLKDDWRTIRKDIDRRPVERLSSDAPRRDIERILQKNTVSTKIASCYGGREHQDGSSSGARRWPMPAFSSWNT